MVLRSMDIGQQQKAAIVLYNNSYMYNSYIAIMYIKLRAGTKISSTSSRRRDV